MEQRGAVAGVALAICLVSILMLRIEPAVGGSKLFRAFALIFILAIIDVNPKSAIKGKPKNSAGSVKLSVFRGKKARLNRLIFLILDLKKALTCYGIYLEIRRVKGFRHTKYPCVFRRVNALFEEGLLRKEGFEPNRFACLSALFVLTVQARVAMVLDKTDLDVFIRTAPDVYLEFMVQLVTVTFKAA